MASRFPVQGSAKWKNAARLAAGCALTSFLLISLSCVLANAILASEHRTLLAAFRAEFTANWLLLTFALVGFTAIAYALRFFQQLRDQGLAGATMAAAQGYVTKIPVRTRGRINMLELADVDWIEAQGNYLALHVGPGVHLIRETLTRLEPRLDPDQFTRIHRSAIVAICRVKNMTSLGAGDALLHLKNGTELRMSRNYRERLAALLQRSLQG